MQWIGDGEMPTAPHAREALGTSSRKAAPSLLLPLALLFSAGLVLRLWALASREFVIQMEEAPYVRAGANLARGAGFVGPVEGWDRMFQPFYPLLVATASFLPGTDIEFEARLVSSLLQAALVIPVFLLASHLYGRKAAILAGTLAAIHPLLILISGTALSEPTYLTLFFTGLLATVMAVEYGGGRAAAAAGVAFGLAYLTRPEGLLFAAASLPIVAFAPALRGARLRSGAWPALCLAIGFGLVGAPRILSLSLQAGEIRFEGKGETVDVLSRRMDAGMSLAEASYAIDENLAVVGPMLEVGRYVATPGEPREPLLARLARMSRNGAEHLRYIRRTIFEAPFGSPVLLVLAVLGLLARPWNARQARGHFVLFLGIGLALVVLSSCRLVLSRYHLIFLPFLLVWAGGGLVHLGDGLRTTLAWTRDGQARRAAAGLQIAAVAAVAALALSGIDQAGDVHPPRPYPATLVRQEAGRWIRSHRPAARVAMERSGIATFYSGINWLLFPWATAPAAQRYVEKLSPDLLVLTGTDTTDYPFAAAWLERGFPSPLFQRIYDRGTGLERVVIYEKRAGPQRVEGRSLG